MILSPGTAEELLQEASRRADGRAVNAWARLLLVHGASSRVRWWRRRHAVVPPRTTRTAAADASLAERLAKPPHKICSVPAQLCLRCDTAVWPRFQTPVRSVRLCCSRVVNRSARGAGLSLVSRLCCHHNSHCGGPTLCRAGVKRCRARHISLFP